MQFSALRIASLVLAVNLLSACQPSMTKQPKYTPLAPSELFSNGMSARMPVAGTVARGERSAGDALADKPTATMTLLRRGQERFNIFCAVCHGRDGYGQGIVTQRGFKPPPSYHEERLRAVPDEHIFNVITNGFGAMYGYGDRVAVADRWAIIAYVRALQLSQNARIKDLPVTERKRLYENE